MTTPHSDETLLTAARGGDDAAYAELWRRHAEAGRRAAGALKSAIEADDLVAEAYLRILSAIRNGHGPRDSFRPYLYAVIRRLAMNWAEEPTTSLTEELNWPEQLRDRDPALALFDHTVTVEAFRSLPEQWRSVLWYSEVEGMSPQEIAPLLGLSANAIAARGYRARSGFKKAWVRAHVSTRGLAPECRRTLTRLLAARFDSDGSDGSAAAPAVRDHLERCERCTQAAAEFHEAAAKLAIILLVASLGPAVLLGRLGVATEAAIGSYGSENAANISRLAPATTSAAASPAHVVQQAALWVAVAAGFFALGLGGLTGSSTVPPEPGRPAQWPETDPAPSAPEAGVSTASGSPLHQTNTVSAQPVTSQPAAPLPDPEPAPGPSPMPPLAVESIALAAVSAMMSASGTGAQPGATIELRARTESLLSPGTFGPERVLASALVADDGSWTAPRLSGITPVNLTMWAVQISPAGIESPTTVIFDGATFDAMPDDEMAYVEDGIANWVLRGWPGAAWLLVDGDGTPLSEGVFNAYGGAVIAVPLSDASSGEVLDFEAGYLFEDALGGMTTTLQAVAP